jgi:transposase InsO family protein
MSATARRRAELTALVVEIFTDSDETYGYRRVHAELGRRGVPAGLELIRAIMRDQGLVPCQPRPWRASLTENDGTAGSIPDLVNRDFTADAPGEKMVGDITYIPTWEGWLYLATVIDCHTKKVVGYAMDDNYKTPLIVEAVRMAARNVTFADDAIFHSDRGSNYTSTSFSAALAEHGARQSVGRTAASPPSCRSRSSPRPPPRRATPACPARRRRGRSSVGRQRTATAGRSAC